MGLPALSGKATCSWCCQGGPRASPADGPSPLPGEGLHQPRLEEEIDFLAQELARQEAGRPRLKAPPQLEAQQRPPEAGETLTRASVRLPTPLTSARSCCANLPSPCSGHPGAFRARPGTRPGPPLHAGSPGAHTPPLPASPRPSPPTPFLAPPPTPRAHPLTPFLFPPWAPTWAEAQAVEYPRSCFPQAASQESRPRVGSAATVGMVGPPRPRGPRGGG